MKTLVSFVCGTVFAAGSAFAQDPQGASPSAAQLRSAPTAAPVTGCPVALTAVRKQLYTDGDIQQITFDKATTAEPRGAWIADNTLVVPRGCSGAYLLSVSFTKDSGPGMCLTGKTGTADDVIVSLYRRGDGAAVALGPTRGAWAGQNSGQRPVASTTFVAVLKEGDHITAWSHSDNNRPRCMLDLVFTAASVR